MLRRAEIETVSTTPATAASAGLAPTEVHDGGQAVTRADLESVLRERERTARRRIFGRRALLAGAGVAAVAGVAELAPRVGQQAGQQIEQQLRAQFEAGLAAGRQALASELLELEGYPLDAAIEVADLTKLGTTRVVKPLANLATSTAGDMLGALEGAVRRAHDAAGFLHLDAAPLDTLASLLATWRAGVTRAQLGDLAERDVTAADLYLRLLRAKLAQEAAATRARGR